MPLTYRLKKLQACKNMNTLQKLFPFAFKPKTNTMNKPHTLYHIVLDRSGSMDDCLEATISGFKEQIQSVQNLSKKYPDQEITIGLTMFNNEIHHLYFNREPEKAEALTEKTYVPNGTTALYDAIFKTCRRIESGIKEINRQEDTTVVVVILTDGYENASQTASLNDVKKMIAELENTGRWTFNFLGATLDAVEVAESMNIKRKNSMAFSKKEIKGKVFARMTSYMEDYVSEKEKMMKENKSLKDININFNKDEE
jgi:hypothetical protein